jgi:hypothetical protein
MYTLQTLLRDACNDSGEVEFRHNYSGRAMYGRECVGITGDMSDCMLVIGEIIKQQKEEPSFDDDVDMLLDFKTDSMGRRLLATAGGYRGRRRAGERWPAHRGTGVARLRSGLLM